MFGSYNFGTSNFGSTSESGGSFSVTSVVSINLNVVEITFSADVAGTSDTIDATNYTINGGTTVVGAWISASNKVRLSTSTQNASQVYVLQISTDVVGALGETLDDNTHEYQAVGAVVTLLVNSLKARTDCRGKMIYLSWNLPAGAEWVRIVRSDSNPILDLTDEHTVVYDNVEISEFTDSGLEEDKFYYYAVLTSVVPNPTDSQLAIDDQSKVEALSIAEKYLTQSKEFVNRNTPNVVLELDSLPVADGGGEGFTDKINTVMACWIALMRGRANSAPLYNDPHRIPFSAIRMKLKDIGLDPDGMSYDLSVPRNMLRFGWDVIRSRGSAPGISKAVHMLSSWDSDIVQIGLNNSNPGKCGRALTTYDGNSKRVRKFAGTFSQTATTMTDSTLALEPDAWIGGIARATATGDAAEVVDNTSTVLTFKTPESIATISAVPTVATYQVSIIPFTHQIKPGMTFQVTNGSNVFVTKAVTVSNTGVITTSEPVPFAFPIGSSVSLELSYLRREFFTHQAVVTEIATDSFRAVVFPSGKLLNTAQFTASGQHSIWVNGAAGAVTVTSNNTTQIFFTAASGSIPTHASNYVSIAVCRGTYSGGSFATRVPSMHYTLRSKPYTAIYNPALDRNKVGSKYDQHNKLIYGANAIGNTWGSGDVLSYVGRDSLTLLGRVQNPAIDIDGSFVLDPTQPLPADGSLVGYYLNPNQAQNELVKITGNTGYKVFTEIPVSPLITQLNYYFVVSPRNAAKYRQLVSRVNSDFSHDDINVRFLFA